MARINNQLEQHTVDGQVAVKQTRRAVEDRRETLQQHGSLLPRPDSKATQQEGQRKLTTWRSLLGSLPVTTDEYCFMQNWLDSAESLWRKGEIGAANYQVRLVLRQLHYHIDQLS